MKEVNSLDGIRDKRRISFNIFTISFMACYIFGVLSWFSILFLPLFIFCGVIAIVFVINLRYWDVKSNMVKMFNELKKVKKK